MSGKKQKIKLKNILITGGAGFIGSRLALKLISEGYSVTVLDNLSPQIHGQNPVQQSPLYHAISGKVNFIKGDVCSRSDVEEAIRNQDAIVHLAAETGTGQSMYQIEQYNHVNVSGTALILDVLVNQPHSIKKIVLASSRAVYGEGKYLDENNDAVYPSGRNLGLMQQRIYEMQDDYGRMLIPCATNETARLQPASYYGLTKLQQEEMVKLICPFIHIPYVILRYQNVYGAGQSLRNPYTGILSVFSTQILNNQPINVFEDGKPSRDFIEVGDVVEATFRSLRAEAALNETINVGTGIATEILHVARMLREKLMRTAEISISGDFRIGDIRHNFADITKMKEILNFEPKVTFEHGISDFAAWVLSQPLHQNKFQASLDELRNKGFLK